MNISTNINIGGIGALSQAEAIGFETLDTSKGEEKSLNVSVNAFSDVEDVDPIVEAAINPADDIGRIFDKAFNYPARDFNPAWFK